MGSRTPQALGEQLLRLAHLFRGAQDENGLYGDAHEARGEKIKIIDGLAEYYQKQRLRVSGSKPETGHGDGSCRNEILDAVIHALDGDISES